MTVIFCRGVQTTNQTRVHGKNLFLWAESKPNSKKRWLSVVSILKTGLKAMVCCRCPLTSIQWVAHFGRFGSWHMMFHFVDLIFDIRLGNQKSSSTMFHLKQWQVVSEHTWHFFRLNQKRLCCRYWCLIYWCLTWISSIPQFEIRWGSLGLAKTILDNARALLCLILPCHPNLIIHSGIDCEWTTLSPQKNWMVSHSNHSIEYILIYI